MQKVMPFSSSSVGLSMPTFYIILLSYLIITIIIVHHIVALAILNPVYTVYRHIVHFHKLLNLSIIIYYYWDIV